MNDGDGFASSNIEEYDDENRIQIRGVTQDTYNANFTDVNTDTYDFEFEVNDTGVSATKTVNVSEAAEGDVSFANDVPVDQVGDVAGVPIQLENTDEATVTIGTSDQNYWIVAHVTDDDGDGEVVVEFNSYTAGSRVPMDQVVTADDEDDEAHVVAQGGSFTDSNSGIAPSVELLDPTQYEMNVTAGHNWGSSDYEDADELGSLSLRERATDNVSSWTASGEDIDFAGDDWDADRINAGIDSNVTTANEIAMEDPADSGNKADYVVLQIVASGLEGAYAHEDPDSLTNAFFGSNQTTLEIEHLNPDANEDEDAINPAPENTTVIGDQANNTYYVAMETGGANNYVLDGQYEANFTVNANSTLNNNDDEPESVYDEYGMIEGDSDINTNENDTALVAAGEGQTISGSTNWAPGTELQIDIESDESTSPFVTRPQPIVQPNGSFTATTDFSELGPGTNLTLTLNGEDYDGLVVEELPDSTPTPTPTPESPTPTESTTDDGGDNGGDTTTTTSGSGPGFTVVAALGALIAAALLAVRRND